MTEIDYLAEISKNVRLIFDVIVIFGFLKWTKEIFAIWKGANK